MSDVEDFLAHYGVPGMKWGKRKSQAVSGNRRKRTPEEKRALAKKVAIGTGTLLAVAGAGYVAYQLKKRGGLKVSNLTVKPEVHTKLAESFATPTKVIHASRGKDQGFQFYKKGGVPDPLTTYEKAFGQNALSKGLSKTDLGTAVTFGDPKGRKDAAGRPISHQILIPKSMSDGINTVEDAVTKIWPMLSDDYDSAYPLSRYEPKPKPRY